MWYIKIINPRLSTVVGNGSTWPTHLTYPKKKISTQKVFYNYPEIMNFSNKKNIHTHLEESIVCIKKNSYTLKMTLLFFKLAKCNKIFNKLIKVCEIFNTFYILIPFNKLFLKAFLCFFYLDIFKYVNKNACKKLMLKSDLRLFIVLLPPISYEAYIT